MRLTLAAGLLTFGSGLLLYVILRYTGDSEDLGRVTAGTLRRIRASEGGDPEDFER